MRVQRYNFSENYQNITLLFSIKRLFLRFTHYYIIYAREEKGRRKAREGEGRRRKTKEDGRRKAGEGEGRRGASGISTGRFRDKREAIPK